MCVRACVVRACGMDHVVQYILEQEILKLCSASLEVMGGSTICMLYSCGLLQHAMCSQTCNHGTYCTIYF